MSTQMIGFESNKIIDFTKLEQIFISLAPDVFRFFNQDPQRTTISTDQSKVLDYNEDFWSRTCLRNGTISIEILQQSRYHDNSMTAEWFYDIDVSIQSSTHDGFILRLFINSLSSNATCKLFCESNSEYQFFIDFYLEKFRSAIKNTN